MNTYFFIGLCVYNILCYADFKCKPPTISGPVLSYKPNRFYQILVGFALTVTMWPIPLALEIWLDLKTSSHSTTTVGEGK